MYQIPKFIEDVCFCFVFCLFLLSNSSLVFHESKNKQAILLKYIQIGKTIQYNLNIDFIKVLYNSVQDVLGQTNLLIIKSSFLIYSRVAILHVFAEYICDTIT